MPIRVTPFWANKDWAKLLYLEIPFLCFTTLRDWHARRFLISPIDIKTQTKNPRKRNSPLNTCVGGIRLEGFMLYLTNTCYLLLSTCIMHTCIAFSSCIILTPCFAAIIDSFGSSYSLEWGNIRLVKTDSSPKRSFASWRKALSTHFA